MKKRIYLLALVPLLALPGSAQAQTATLPSPTSFIEGSGGLNNLTWTFQNDFSTAGWFEVHAYPATFSQSGGESDDEPGAPTNVHLSLGNFDKFYQVAGSGTFSITFNVPEGVPPTGDDEPPAEMPDSGTMTMSVDIITGDPNTPATWINNIRSVTFTESDVPEPSTSALLGMGAVSLLVGAWRRLKARI